MRQDGENGRQKGGATHAGPKKHHQMKPGAPPGGSTWNLVELRLGLNLETRRTAAVDEALYRRGHARTAYGTVADNDAELYPENFPCIGLA